MSSVRGVSTTDNYDEFITVIRTAANDAGKTIPVYLHGLLDGSATIAGPNNTKLLSYESFESDVGYLKNMKKKVNRSELKEIYDECSAGGAGITVDSLAQLCQRNVSKARTQALKLRSVIIARYKGEVEHKRAFDTMKPITVDHVKYVDVDSFREFAEDQLEVVLTESDGDALYSLYDGDGDGKVSCDDFCKFISSQAHATTDAASALQTGDPNVIVDLKISVNRAAEADLQQQGYTCLLPQFASTIGALDRAAFGSFGRGQSIWVWKRGQGTCGGRLKPIIDIQLDTHSTSSSLVLGGYICLGTAVGGQHVWIKRAQTVEEEENEAITALYITTGKMRDLTDPIWQGPGGGGSSNAAVGRDGWIRIDGNFGKGMMSSSDAFMWFQPIRPKSLDAYMASPIRKAVTLSDEMRYNMLLALTQTAIRHYIPLSEMKKLASVKTNIAIKAAKGANPQHVIAGFNFFALFQMYDRSYRGGSLNYSAIEKLCSDIGLRVERPDMQRIFYFFNIAQDDYISHEEFSQILLLTDYEIDNLCGVIRKKLLASNKIITGTGKRGDKKDTEKQDGACSTQIKENKLLSNIFKSINHNGSGVLSLDEVIHLCYTLDLYVTEQEGSKIMALMDVGGDDRVEEGDFIAFIQHADDTLTRKAARVREAAAIIRRWLHRRSNSTSNLAAVNPKAAKAATKQQQKEWNELRKRHEKSGRGYSGHKFPGYLNVEDAMLLLATLGVRLAPMEVYEVVYIIALDKNGKVYPNDLEAFSFRSCRTFGELVAMFDRDVMEPLLKIYRKHHEAQRRDDENAKQLTAAYQEALKDVIKAIQDAYSKELLVAKSQGMLTAEQGGAGSSSSSKIDVVSVTALKRGFEDALKGYHTTEQLMPNLEEYVCLACLVGADIACDGTYGINIQGFVEGLCRYITKDNATSGTATTGNMDQVALEMLSQDLRRMIVEEAINAAFSNPSSKYKGDLHLARKNPDYEAVFTLFDEDHSGSISLEEFRDLLMRLQLVDALPKEQLPALLSLFDKGKKGYITCTDFVLFVKMSNEFSVDDDDDDSMNSGGDGELELLSQEPPVAITQHKDCDYLSWQLWRQCMLIDSQDPEAIITDVEGACCDVELALMAADLDLDDDEDAALKRNPVGYIAKDELWMIVSDLMETSASSANLVVPRDVFDKGVASLMEQNGKGKGKGHTGRADYQSLCKFVVKMGRAFNAKVQEKHSAEQTKFTKMKDQLLMDMVSNDVSDGADGKPGVSTSRLSRYEKIFKRLDSDGDGKISCQEFKLGLKRCKFKDEKFWTVQHIRKLFNDLDANHDGDLSISELTTAIRNAADRTGGGAAKKAANKGHEEPMRRRNPISPGDDDDDEMFVRRKKLFSEYEVYRKVFDVLLDTVALDDYAGKNGSTVEAIISVIRRLFRRSDSEGKGVVTEERFLSFCRKSELQERLSTVELKRVLENLKTNNENINGNVKSSGSARKKTTGSYMINYELFCQMLASVGESSSHSHSAAVVEKVQEAAAVSAQAGRPFIMLCELMDNKGSGKLSVLELQHVCKMMGCELTVEEVHILREMLHTPHSDTIMSTPGRSKKDRAGDGNTIMVNYDELDELLTNYAPQAGAAHGKGYRTTPGGGRTGSLPTYASPGMPTIRPRALHHSDSTNSFGSPLKRGGTMGGTLGGFGATGTLGGTAGGKEGMYQSMVVKLCEATNRAVQSRISLWGRNFLLQRQFEEHDRHRAGYVSMAVFQSVLEDDLGIAMRSSEITAVRHMFAVNERGADTDAVDYQYFCLYCDQVDSEGGGVADRGTLSGTRTRGGATLGHSRSGRGNHNSSLVTGVERAGRGHSNSGDGKPSYASERVIRRYMELQDGSSGLQEALYAADHNDTGMVSANTFTNVLRRLNLLQYEYQLTQAADDFRSLGNPSFVQYEEFCNLLEREAVDLVKGGSSSGGGGRFGNSMAVVDEDSVDSVLDNRTVDNWLHTSATPKQQREFSGMYSSLKQFKHSSRGGDRDRSNRDRGSAVRSSARSEQNEDWGDEDSSDSRVNRSMGGKYDLYPPKPTTSFSMNDRSGSGAAHRYLTNSASGSGLGWGSVRRSGDSDRDADFVSSSINSVQSSSPRSPGKLTKLQSSPGRMGLASPSRVGAAMWGNETPMATKGRTVEALDDADYLMDSGRGGSDGGASAANGGRWVCPVCYYTENDVDSKECEVCNSPNHLSQKVDRIACSVCYIIYIVYMFLISLCCLLCSTVL